MIDYSRDSILNDDQHDGMTHDAMPFNTDDMYNYPRLPEDGLDLYQYLREQEMALINQALTRSNGVVADAARSLKINRTTLVEKLRKFGIKRESFIKNN